MALTTHEKIRTEAGFQSQFIRESFLGSPDGAGTIFYVNSDDNVKFVPNFNTGATIAGVSDVQVWLGLSGIYGVSRIAVNAIDIDQGSVTLGVTPVNGCSLIISYASSAITSQQVEDVRLQAESMINQRLSLCYDMPMTTVPSSLTSMATRLSAALLLIRGYGTGSRTTATDGYALYEQLMGENYAVLSQGSDSETSKVGEVGLICTPRYQLIDDNGKIIPRNDSGSAVTDSTYTAGGKVAGRIYDITEEQFRFKEWQTDVNKDQSGSGL